MSHDSSTHSIDGHWFRFSAPIDAGLVTGGYVRIDTDDGRAYLGQVLGIEAGETGPKVTTVAGHGAIRATTGDDAFASPGPFGSASITPADPATVRAHFERSLGTTAPIEIGKVRAVAGEPPATLHAAGFGRHTFVCGQSGSGKTYTLGVILERLLLETDLRMVVFDPNSDYVRLGEMRDAKALGIDSDSYADLADRYATVTDAVRVFGQDPGELPLRSRFGRLAFHQQTLVLDLDPLRDAEEFHAFRQIVRAMETVEYSLHDIRDRAAADSEAGSRRLALRIDNLGVADLSIWSPPGEPVVLEHVPDDWRAVVLDLGSLPSAEERSLMAASAVSYFWDRRYDRTPTLLVIDEAHNVGPRAPADRFQAMASDHLSAIAAEGRKFGLYLLLVTQRPEKVHGNVLSQCENLVLMRMNSASDIELLSSTFSHVPEPLIRQAAGFGLGEGLAAGRIATDPILFRTGSRYSMEGGSDIATTWATRR
jgi:DNA helicase HerA-like ATPase